MNAATILLALMYLIAASIFVTVIGIELINLSAKGFDWEQVFFITVSFIGLILLAGSIFI